MGADSPPGIRLRLEYTGKISGTPATDMRRMSEAILLVRSPERESVWQAPLPRCLVDDVPVGDADKSRGNRLTDIFRLISTADAVKDFLLPLNSIRRAPPSDFAGPVM